MINDELNIFARFFDNTAFIVILVIICCGQFVIVQFGSLAMKCHVNGLTGTQWAMCILIGLFSMVVNFIMKFVPDTIWPKLGTETEEDIQKAKNEYIHLRKTRDLSHSSR